MIELHIQIDLERNGEQIATVINKKNANLNEVNNLIAELERAKEELLSYGDHDIADTDDTDNTDDFPDGYDDQGDPYVDTTGNPPD